MGLLTDLYNTVAKFFRSQDGGEDEASKSVATSRLKLVLMQDRTNLTPKILEQMRGELVDLLSKYLEMDKDLLELNFEQEGDQVALMLSIPVIRAKDEDEIEKALTAQKKDSDEDNSEIIDESADDEFDNDESADNENKQLNEGDEDDEIVDDAGANDIVKKAETNITETIDKTYSNKDNPSEEVVS